MFTLLMTIAVIVAVLLVIMVLLQSSKGGGLAGTFGGGGANVGTMFGTRRTADFLGKATWWLGGALLIIALLINLFFLPTNSKGTRDSIIQKSTQQTVPTTPNLPQQKK